MKSGDKHSLLSASASHRWLHCPMSILLTYGQDSSSKAAEDGTACHTALEYYIRNGKLPTNEYMTNEYSGWDESLMELTQQCADMANAILGVKYPETRVNYADVLGIPIEQMDDAFGTVDIIAVEQRDHDTVLHVADAKFGRVFVQVKYNSQLLLYAAGVVDILRDIVGITRVAMHILQPKASEEPMSWEIPIEEFDQIIASDIVAPANNAIQFIEEVRGTPDYDPLSQDAAKYYSAGDHCENTYCPARQGCPAYNKAFIQVRQWENRIAAIAQRACNISNEELADMAAKAEVARNLCDVISDELNKRVLSGEVVPGYKTVLGREGNRKWEDEDAAATEMLSHLPDDVVFDRKVKSPAQMEKTLKKVKISPDIMSPLIVRSPAKLMVVKDSDGRPAVGVTSRIDQMLPIVNEVE